MLCPNVVTFVICNGKTVNKVTAPGKAISLRKICIYIYVEVEENKTNKNKDNTVNKLIGTNGRTEQKLSKKE